ncbi:MAG: hypothetical protein IPI13_07390 [Actinomycetales bacterium]|uniref:Uncharacterized protein n=1 Tax=Candidatus Phosphoribacter hodrii TaxID=2953743 RepID=A0A935IUF8_9MICO|nr:hypothetical protein [Candidatus Phosphoribacter hodrii]
MPPETHAALWSAAPRELAGSASARPTRRYAGSPASDAADADGRAAAARAVAWTRPPG